MTIKKGFLMLRKILTILGFITVYATVAMAADDEAAKAAVIAAKNAAISGDHFGSIGAGLAIGIAVVRARDQHEGQKPQGRSDAGDTIHRGNNPPEAQRHRTAAAYGREARRLGCGRHQRRL